MKPLIHDEVVRVRVSTEMHDALKEHCYSVEEATVSSVIRRLIKNLLESKHARDTH